MKKLGLTQYAIECLEGKHAEEIKKLIERDEREKAIKRKSVYDKKIVKY